MITDPAHIKVVMEYCAGMRIDCHAIHTPPESTIGGFSCRLLSIDGDTATIKIANDDVWTVPVAEIHLRDSTIWEGWKQR